MNNKEKYRTHCHNESSIPIFSKDWWLDAVCGEENWDVCIFEQNDQIVASMPYVIKKRYVFDFCTQPLLTQTLGPWIKPIPGKYAKSLGKYKDLIEGLISQLPQFDHFEQKWHHSLDNWLPFYWAGFQQTTRYTYILEDLSDLDKIWEGLQGNIRTDIRKAKDKFGVTVSDEYSINDFLKLNKMTFDRNNKKLPYSESFIEKLEKATSNKNCSKTLIAYDEDGKLHAGAFLVWDDNTTYYLMGGGDPVLRNSGATSLCLWEAIKLASTVSKSFDFEGSMLEPVERFFRGFGAKQTPYFAISKTNSKALKCFQTFNSLTK